MATEQAATFVISKTLSFLHFLNPYAKNKNLFNTKTERHCS